MKNKIGMALLAALGLSSIGVLAQSYPVKAVRVLVPQAPGGGNDTMARLIGQKLSGTLKQQFAIDNRAGAGGMIAAELAAKAPPDGYTLLLSNVATMAIIPNVQKKPPYDALKDFEPISLLAQAPLLVVVHPSLPVKSMKDLVALAKSKPGQVNYASNGIGSSTHLATELFIMMSGIQLSHVPYKGLAPALIDVLSGQVPLMFSSAVAMMPHVKAGRLKALAITGSARSSLAPEIPTASEAGVPGYVASPWYGVLAPARTPRAIVERLNREFRAAVEDPVVREQLAPQGMSLTPSTPDEFGRFIRDEVAKWAKVVQETGIKVE